jgi:hypothetical protein
MYQLNKIGIAAAAMALSLVVLGAPAPASARDGQNAALIGGLAAGAVIGGVIAGGSQGYYRGEPAHDQYYPAYRTAPAYRAYPAYSEFEVYDAPRPRQCYAQRQPIYNHWGDFAGYRRVRVCR